MKKKLKKFVISMSIFALGLTCYAYTSGYLEKDIPVIADARDSVELPILMYHSITSDKSKVNEYTILSGDFEKDMAWLQEKGYTSISPDQLVDYVEKGSLLPSKPVMITFDDGYSNNYSLAFPILEKYNMKATIIGSESDISTQGKKTNQKTTNLSWDDVSNMYNTGLISFGNHTYSLHQITDTRKGADKAKGEAQETYEALLSEDLSLNQEKIKETTGSYPIVFAWPYGAYPMDGSANQVLKNLGFKMSLTSYQITNTIHQGDSDGLFGLKRFLRTPGFDMNKII